MGIRQVWDTLVQASHLTQPDAVTCQAACIAMAAGLGRDHIQPIRRELLRHGVAGDPRVMERVLRDRLGSRYSLDLNANLNKTREWLKAGEFLITHGWFTGSGHVICLDGLDKTQRGKGGGDYRFNVRDPWGEFHFPSWRYVPGTTYFDGYYSAWGIYAACVGGVSVAHARDLYRRGILDSSQGRMWVHRIRPATPNPQPQNQVMQDLSQRQRFEVALKFTLQWEGGRSDHPADLGGKTNKGVTQQTYNYWRQAHGRPPVDVNLITDAEVTALYYEQFWGPSQAGRFVLPLGAVVFDTAVNFGVRGSVLFLQQAWGLVEDGIWGPQTERLAQSRNSKQVALDLIQLRINYRQERVLSDPSQSVFLQGWLNRDRALRKFVEAMP